MHTASYMHAPMNEGPAAGRSLLIQRTATTPTALSQGNGLRCSSQKNLEDYSCRLADIILSCRWVTVCIARSWDITAARRTPLTCAKPCPGMFTSAVSKLGKTAYIRKSSRQTEAVSQTLHKQDHIVSSSSSTAIYTNAAGFAHGWFGRFKVIETLSMPL